MKNIKNLIAIAVAAAIMSPMAAIANLPPDNVGNVTYMGNIVANSPMWQWTVNDYPGPRLDAKPNEATTTADGVTTYKLAGQPFIAVSGYLPSMTGMVGPDTNTIGVRDITEFRDGNGSPITDIKSLAEPQAMSFAISAVSTDASGAQAVGKLTLKATEVRGGQYAGINNSDGRKVLASYVVTTSGKKIQTPGGSCFVGNGGPALTFSGEGADIKFTNGSKTAAAAYLNALQQADVTGNIKLASLDGYTNSPPSEYNAGCETPTTEFMSSVTSPTAHRTYHYMAAAHIVELTPTELEFNTPVQGAWNATLNVTAYQM
ncbi:hypothetical protein GKR48_15685 [Providencia sp. wls1943]|uniref:hypothetical protein n=1 Tax=Providencia sp. wls1943 TaxID=2675150 RepID=UPI0012B551F8|nr:hypothetical protein [Providencia sp. wls1943]ELR5201461.1 hypothetical protein [Providencia rettgeri]MTB68238.1 hypothetical protein [Providencia sp. wls1943]